MNLPTKKAKVVMETTPLQNECTRLHDSVQMHLNSIIHMARQETIENLRKGESPEALLPKVLDEDTFRLMMESVRGPEILAAFLDWLEHELRSKLNGFDSFVLTLHAYQDAKLQRGATGPVYQGGRLVDILLPLLKKPRGPRKRVWIPDCDCGMGCEDCMRLGHWEDRDG